MAFNLPETQEPAEAQCARAGPCESATDADDYRFFFGFFCSFFIDVPFDIRLSFCWRRASVLRIGLFAYCS